MRRALALLLAAALTLALAGCQAEEPIPTETMESTPTPTPTRAVETVRFTLGYDPTASLHPVTGDSQVNQDLTGLVYQGLYELDNSFTPRPVLARSAQTSEDGLVWIFTLKSDVFFSDGTPLTAAHVVDSLNQARTSALYGARLAQVTSVTAGDGAVVITLSAPNGSLPALLDIPVVLEQGEIAPLGTGYYQYEFAGEGLALRTNPYHPSAAALPYDMIPLTPMSTADQRIAAFDSGQVTAVTTDFTGAYALGYSSSYETTDCPTTSLLYVGFQTGRGPCQFAVVRRAFSRAFDRETAVRVLLSGHALASALPVSPVCGEYDGEAAAMLDYDMESAAALLGEAGYAVNEEDGLLYRGRTALAVTLLVNSDSESKQAVAAQLAESLESLGVAVTVTTLAWADYSAALSAGNFDLYIGEVRLTGDFDPTALLTGDLNFGGYQSQTMPGLLARWRAAQGEGRTEAAAPLWQQFVQDVPIAPLCFKNCSLLMRWGMAGNLQPTRANPFYRMEEWTTVVRG